MPFIEYRAMKMAARTLATIDAANRIITEYAAQGYELTLRQLYYQFVSRGLIANNLREYKKLGETIANGRLAGLVDWEAIVDRTRELRSLSHWASPADIVLATAQQFRVDRWEGQPHRVEVWIEKDALVGVIGKVCEQYDVSYFSCRGYTSQSEMWVAAQRHLDYENLESHDGGTVGSIILHFGDHDPSGIDMTRDIEDRMHEFGCHSLEVRRMALNMPQVDRYNPPPNPAKMTDSRVEGYIRKFGRESWELDALEPSVINDLIETEVLRYIDQGQWVKVSKVQEEGRATLAKVADGLAKPKK